MARKKTDNAKITGLTVSRKEGERITICTSDGPIVVIDYIEAAHGTLPPRYRAALRSLYKSIN